MNIGPAFIANPESAELVAPSMGPFNDPAVSPKAVLGFDSPSRNTGLDTTISARTAAPGIVVPFVGVQLGRTEAEAGPEGQEWQGYHPANLPELWSRERWQPSAAGSTECPFDRREDDVSSPVCLYLSGWGRSYRPLFAATVAESTAARSQSICPARPNFSRSRWCNRSQTPALCHSFSRRQQVMPLPQPISLGSISQGMPLRRTNRMPVNAARSDTRGRPPFGFGFSGGNRGAICSQSLSSRSGRILRPRITCTRFC